MFQTLTNLFLPPAISFFDKMVNFAASRQACVQYACKPKRNELNSFRCMSVATAYLQHQQPQDATRDPAAVERVAKKLASMNRWRTSPKPDYRETNDGVSKIDITAVVKSVLQQRDEYPFATVREEKSLHDRPKRHIVIDYSSPNIAKPFHTGNWRSTVLGNFIANLHERCGNHVERINYLGDWGAQFGMLAGGFYRFGSESELEHGKLDHLLEVYIKANAEAEKNAEFKAECVQLQTRLESETDEQMTAMWHRMRALSLEYYTQMYDNLGLTPFNHVQYESSYARNSEELVKELLTTSPLSAHASPPDTTDYSVMLEGNNNPVRLLKSDGSSLYLSRDIAAIKQRAEQFNFDSIYYVVDNAQSDHFKNLFNIVRRGMPELFGEQRELRHIKFGRILGMSTRKGDVVKIQDVIREATRIAHERIEHSRFSRSDDPAKTAHFCALSALIVNDLKSRRSHDYEYEPARFLHFEGDTGMSVQYVHARLCSIERMMKQNHNLVPNENAVLGAIVEYEGSALAKCLAESQQAVKAAYDELEPCHIVQYLFRLRHKANKAVAKLRVIGEREDIATARLTLFSATRIITNVLLKTIGITPLDKM